MRRSLALLATATLAAALALTGCGQDDAAGTADSAPLRIG